MAKIKSEVKKKSKLVRFWAILFLLGAIFFVSIFSWYPILISWIIAFQEYWIFGARWVGLTNFKRAFSDPMLGLCFKNTFYYAFLSISLTFLLPIFIAILLMEMKKSVIRIMMILWFIPSGSMAGLFIWKWFYNPQFGLFNGILTFLGLPTLMWLNDSRIAMLCIVLPSLIMYGPGLIWIATLQSIPDEFYEAAELEGARLWTKIWHITLPRMRPMISMMLILAVIGSIQVFSQPYVMTGGGPGYATRTLVMYIITSAFDSLHYGYGTALAIILFFVLMVLIIIQRKFFKENIDQ